MSDLHILKPAWTTLEKINEQAMVYTLLHEESMWGKLSRNTKYKFKNLIKEIFKMNLPTNTYRAEKINIYNDNEYTPKKGIHLGTLGVTPEDKGGYLLLFNKNGDKIIKDYNLTFTKDKDFKLDN